MKLYIGQLVVYSDGDIGKVVEINDTFVTIEWNLQDGKKLRTNYVKKDLFEREEIKHLDFIKCRIVNA